VGQGLGAGVDYIFSRSIWEDPETLLGKKLLPFFFFLSFSFLFFLSGTSQIERKKDKMAQASSVYLRKGGTSWDSLSI